jgi:hypothetical protein
MRKPGVKESYESLGEEEDNVQEPAARLAAQGLLHEIPGMELKKKK